MTRHSIIAKTVLLLFVCLVSVGAVDWSTLTPEKLSKLPASDFTNINANELASIPVAACSGFQSAQIAAIDVAAIIGFSSGQLGQLNGSCSGFSGAQLKALVIPYWGAFTPDCMSNLRAKDMGGCTAISAAVLEQLLSNQIRAISSDCLQVIPPAAFNVTESSNVLKVFMAITGYACEGYTPQQMKFFPKNAGYYFAPQCVVKFSMDLCAALDPVFVSSLPANAFSFTKQCISKMAPDTFSEISVAQFGMIADTSCAAFSPGLVHNLPPYLATNLGLECLKNFTAEACAAMTYRFARSVFATTLPGFSAECIRLMPDYTLQAFDRPYIYYLTPQAFGAIDRLHLFSQETLLDVSMEQWLNVAKNLGGVTAFGIAQVLTTTKVKTFNPVFPMKLVAKWTEDQVSNYWQLDQFMSIVEENVRNSKIADLLWNETKSLSDLTWMEVALLKPLSELQNISQFAAESMAGLRRDQISLLSPQSFQNFTAAQSYYFRSNIITTFFDAQVKELKPETFANMTNGFKYLNPSVISSLTIAQLRALNEKDFSEFSCEQLQQFKREQIQGLETAARQRFADLRSKCSAWSDPAIDQPPSKLTLVEIVLIGCGSAIIVIAMIIIAVVKIKKNAADRERAPLLGSEETRVNNQRKY